MSKKRTPWDYIVPVSLPADLKGVTPGKLPENLLRPAAGGGKLHWIAAAAWAAMVEAAKADGVELKPTSSGDVYRDYDSQKRGFLQRYQLEPIQGTSTKEFEGKKWYLKKGMAMLATPGKSQHNLGIAVDVHSASEPKRINWLIANVEKFGWSWEVVPSEPWHIRYVAGDKIPAAVKAYMDKNGISAPVAGSATPAKPSAAAPQTASATSKPAAAPAGYSTGGAKQRGPAMTIGEDSPRAKKLQKALADKGYYKSALDGKFGPKTSEALKKFKADNGLPADNVAGPRVLDLLDID
jgi:hypothetical protein